MTVGTDPVQDLQQAVRDHARVLPRAGGTKPALSTAPDGVAALDVSGLSGIVDYDPGELTFTALAATPVREVVQALDEHQQYLPFDPPWVEAGATLGGVVAAGTSGPCSYRHGGVRDFIIGVRFIDGTARVRNAGVKVVKNAAGFDVPKLMVGSIGRLGILLQLSFKVFPAPRAWATLRVDVANVEAALDTLERLTTGPFDLEAVDLEPPRRLWLRLGGPPAVMDARLQRLERFVGGRTERLEGVEEAAVWRSARELEWAGIDAALVKVALLPERLIALDAALERGQARRRYSRGANLAWVAWPPDRPLEELDGTLRSLSLSGLVLTGAPRPPLIGRKPSAEFVHHVRVALDPRERFLEV